MNQWIINYKRKSFSLSINPINCFKIQFVDEKYRFRLEYIKLDKDEFYNITKSNNLQLLKDLVHSILVLKDFDVIKEKFNMLDIFNLDKIDLS